MDEFDDDADFADFDLDGAVASARKAPPPPSSSMQNDHPNIALALAANDCKRPPLDLGAPGSGKKAKTAPDGDVEGSVEAEPSFTSEDAAVPEDFKHIVMETLQEHFGHSTFRPGQLSVLHAVLGDDADGNGARDACVFWATG